MLKNYLAATLGLAQREDAFFVGMRSGVTAFHEALREGAELPVDGAQATEVLEWCDAVAGKSSCESAGSLPLSEAPPREGEVVVLGGTGFIGKRVVERLLAAGRPVTCLVRRTHSLPTVVEEAAKDGRIRLKRGSLEDAADLAELFTGAQAVVHLATGNGDTWAEVKRAMIDGSVEVARASQRCGVERFIYISSIASLYTGGDAPAPSLLDSPETDPKPEARSLYSKGKAATERALFELFEKEKLPLVVFRPGVVVGEGTPMQHSGYGLWARDNHCVGWGLGENPLPLVWVDDVADAIVAAVQHEKGEQLFGEALNLCARPPLCGREIVEELRRVTGRDLHFHPRGLFRSQLMEVGKWLVKLAGRRPGLEFPSYRDLKARALEPSFECDLARKILGWTPVEEREAFLDRTVRIYAPKSD